MPAPLGFNEAPIYVRSPSVSPSLAHLLKLTVYDNSPDDIVVFYFVKSLAEYYTGYKTEHAPLVDEKVWQYHNTCAALFDEWIERDDLHIILYDSLQNQFARLQDIADIRALGTIEWGNLLRTTLQTQRWKDRDMKFYVVSADVAWM